MFNRTDATADLTVRWSDLGLAPGAATVRDLWRKTDLGTSTDAYTVSVKSHGVAMVLVTGSEF